MYLRLLMNVLKLVTYPVSTTTKKSEGFVSQGLHIFFFFFLNLRPGSLTWPETYQLVRLTGL